MTIELKKKQELSILRDLIVGGCPNLQRVLGLRSTKDFSKRISSAENSELYKLNGAHHTLNKQATIPNKAIPHQTFQIVVKYIVRSG